MAADQAGCGSAQAELSSAQLEIKIFRARVRFSFENLSSPLAPVFFFFAPRFARYDLRYISGHGC